MRKPSIFALALTLTCCTPKYEKPFTIISKSGDCVTCDDNNYSYSFQDSSGNIGTFQDRKDKYDIGDVIR